MRIEVSMIIPAGLMDLKIVLKFVFHGRRKHMVKWVGIRYFSLLVRVRSPRAQANWHRQERDSVLVNVD